MNNEKLKEERFIKIAEKRTNNILYFLKLLGNCANTNNYKYSDAQVKKIFSAIDAELKSTKLKFDKREKVFTLRGE